MKASRLSERQVHRQRRRSRSSARPVIRPTRRRRSSTRRSRASASRRTSRSSTSPVDVQRSTAACRRPAIDACPNVGWIRDWSRSADAARPDVRRLQHRPDQQLQLEPWSAGRTGRRQRRHLHERAADDARSGDEGGRADRRRSARAQAWANVDKMLVDQAVAVPWAFDKQPNIESKDVRGDQRAVEHRLVGLQLHVAEVEHALTVTVGPRRSAGPHRQIGPETSP